MRVRVSCSEGNTHTHPHTHTLRSPVSKPEAVSSQVSDPSSRVSDPEGIRLAQVHRYRPGPQQVTEKTQR